MTSPSTHADHDSAIVFMTYQTGQEVMERFRTLLAQAGGMSACYLLLDAATPGIEHAWRSFMRDNAMEGATLVTFLAKDVAADLSVPLFTPDRLIPGSAHLPLTWLARKLGHKLFWFVEDDVVYTGDWADFFRLFTADTADLLCSHHYSFTDFPRWAWWPTLEAPPKEVRGKDLLVLAAKGFFPIYRISARGLSKVHAYQRAGWKGHFETLVPTVLRHAGFPVRDFNRVAPAPVYSAGALRPGEGSDTLSSLRFRPAIRPHERQPPGAALILHPVKPDAPES